MVMHANDNIILPLFLCKFLNTMRESLVAPSNSVKCLEAAMLKIMEQQNLEELVIRNYCVLQAIEATNQFHDEIIS